MGKQQNRKEREGVVYSTAENFNYQYQETGAEAETLKPNQQNLRVMLDKKQRAGKKVTLVSNFVGTEDDLKEIEKDIQKLTDKHIEDIDNTIEAKEKEILEV
jgi:translation initiation factor 1